MTKSEDNLLSMDHYVRKTFFKTASLMANSCRAVAILGGGDDVVSQAAWDYGRNLGLAFQVPSTQLQSCDVPITIGGHHGRDHALCPHAHMVAMHSNASGTARPVGAVM